MISRYTEVVESIQSGTTVLAPVKILSSFFLVVGGGVGLEIKMGVSVYHLRRQLDH